MPAPGKKCKAKLGPQTSSSRSRASRERAASVNSSTLCPQTLANNPVFSQKLSYNAALIDASTVATSPSGERSGFEMKTVQGMAKQAVVTACNSFYSAWQKRIMPPVLGPSYFSAYLLDLAKLGHFAPR